VLGGHALDDLLQHRGEVLDDEDGLGAGVLELVLEFTRRVERVHVHDDEARPQDGRHGHRVLEEVGHHHRHAVALLQAQALQIGRHGARGVVHLGEAQALAHHQVGGLGGVLLERGVQQVDQARVERRVDVARHFGRVMLQPDGLHGLVSFSMAGILTDGCLPTGQGIR